MSIRAFEDKIPTISTTAYIDESAVVIGDVSVGSHSSLWPMVVARGDVNSIIIGERTNIQDGSILHVTHATETTGAGFALTIGNCVTVGHRALLHGCSVGDYCLVGMAATIMDGAVVPARTVVAAGALVPPGKTLEEGCLWIGSPARRARELNESELAMLAYSAEHYVRLKSRHRPG